MRSEVLVPGANGDYYSLVGCDAVVWYTFTDVSEELTASVFEAEE
jgi:hypothetical protein